MRTPEENKRRNAARCRHFNGMMNKECRAGVSYEGMREEQSPSTPLINALPCWGDPQTPGRCICEHYAPYTAEELAEKEAQHKKNMEAIAAGKSPCCDVPLDTSRVIASGRYKGHGPRYCSRCGKLIFMV